MAFIERFVRGVDHSRTQHNFPTHALWINITAPGEIDIAKFDFYAAKINPYLMKIKYEGVRRDLKYLAFGTDVGDFPRARMILFYAGFDHSTYLARIGKKQDAPIRSGGLVSLIMPEEGLPIVERRVWSESRTLQTAGKLDRAVSNAFKFGVMRQHLEPPFTFG
ncbi:hypothetical protein HYS97_02970 [Candidatus Daviesbacteria bacterium]|nr:hypothetical protein [Candidatus Daviesbacteria bacterium]